MLAEHAVVFDSYNVVRVIWVVVTQVKQDLEFYSSLMLELLLVSNDLDCDCFSSFVINAFQCLTKGAFPQEVDDLKPVGNMILQDHIIITAVIIISAIIINVLMAFDLFGSKTKIITSNIVKELTLFILRKIRLPQEMLQHFGTRKG